MGRSSSNHLLFLLVILVVLCVILPASQGAGVYAFGAGNIPSFAYLEGKAFRHGDVEDCLTELAKAAGGGGLAFFGHAGKFYGIDIKRVYFGNWLRDYSQAVDIASLKKTSLQTIINLCMVLGFMAHGYATHEFEVTPERLGVYLPTEHIDNPKGYGEGEDARKYDPRLRGPVDPRELEVDPRTGMKNYIANESGTWDTSKALVRRRIEECIHFGRQHRAHGRKQDLYECYRLLGTFLHTLEDFSAHSNFCELALVNLGHSEVFTHVGDHVRIRATNGRMVAPLVTGSFGGSDFVHSLLGEATDHISEASVSDLNRELNTAKQRSRAMGPGGPGGNNASIDSTLRDLFFQLPGGGGKEMARDMEGIQKLRADPNSAAGKRPEDMSPQELHAVLWQVLVFRDSVAKKIDHIIEKIPGLGPLLEKITQSIQVFIYTTLEPYLRPLLKTATTALSAGSAEVIDNHDQYEVFNDPICSDPTHSFLSKDHFNLILNEPAGHIAMIIVRNTVRLVTPAWDNPNLDARAIAEECLQCLFHPDFHNPQSKVQREMLSYMGHWLESYGYQKHEIIRRLTKESVRNHNNIRIAEAEGAQQSHGSTGGGGGGGGGFAAGLGGGAQHFIQGKLNAIPGVSQAQSLMNTFSNITGGFGQRDIPGGVPGGPPGGTPSSPTSARPPAVPTGPYVPPPSTGQAASYYGSGPPSHASTPAGPPPGPGAYSPPPSGPPPSGGPGFPSAASYGSSSPYGAPPGPPPGGFPSPHAHGPPPMGFPSPQPQGPGSPYGAPPGAPPGFPSPMGAPPGPPGGYYPPGGPPPPGGPQFPQAGPGYPGYGSPPPGPPGAPPPGQPPYGYGGGYYGPPR